MKVTPINTAPVGDIKSKGKDYDCCDPSGICKSGAHSLPTPISPSVGSAIHSLSQRRQRLFPRPLPKEGEPLSDQDRAYLRDQLVEFTKLLESAQGTYSDMQTPIQWYQQLVLSTHSKVADTRQKMQQARQMAQAHTITSSTLPLASTATSTPSLVSLVSSLSSLTFVPHNHDLEHGNGNIRDGSSGYHPVSSNASSRTSSPPLSPSCISSSTTIATDASSPPLSPSYPSSSSSLSTIVTASFHGQETVAVQACEDDTMLVIRLEKEYEDVGKKLTRFLREKKEWEDAKEQLKIELAEIKARIKEIDHRITD